MKPQCNHDLELKSVLPIWMKEGREVWPRIHVCAICDAWAMRIEEMPEQPPLFGPDGGYMVAAHAAYLILTEREYGPPSQLRAMSRAFSQREEVPK